MQRFSFHTPMYPIMLTIVIRTPMTNKVYTITAYVRVTCMRTRWYLQNMLQTPIAKTPKPEIWRKKILIILKFIVKNDLIRLPIHICIYWNERSKHSNLDISSFTGIKKKRKLKSTHEIKQGYSQGPGWKYLPTKVVCPFKENFPARTLEWEERSPIYLN